MLQSKVAYCGRTDATVTVGPDLLCIMKELVAKLYSPEFGKYYSDSLKPRVYPSVDSELKLLHKRSKKGAEKMVKDGKLSPEIAYFCYEFDFGVKLSPVVCKAVYSLIEDFDFSVFIGEPYATGLNRFRRVIGQCVSSVSSLAWA